LTLCPLGALRALLALLELRATGPGTGRGRDCQSSDACGENQPGHHKNSFRESNNGAWDAPFHCLPVCDALLAH
jgi:hypothetical protein